MTIDVGVYTSFRVDLSEFDFNGRTKVILTIRNRPDEAHPVVAEREYTEAKLYDDVITPEESVKLFKGAVYDFDEVLTDGKRYKICDNKPITLRKGCGRCQMN
jgi:hypothetical protein